MSALGGFGWPNEATRQAALFEHAYQQMCDDFERLPKLIGQPPRVPPSREVILEAARRSPQRAYEIVQECRASLRGPRLR